MTNLSSHIDILKSHEIGSKRVRSEKLFNEKLRKLFRVPII